MFQIFTSIFDFIHAVFWAIGNALTLNPRVFEAAQTYPHATWITATIAIVAGVSTLLGQSAVMFANRVPRNRFLYSLIANGFLFLVRYLFLALTIGVLGRLMFPTDPAPGSMMSMIGLSTAPLVFGFLILIPYMGPFIGKVLNGWSFVILMGIVAYQFQVSALYSAICVSVGWVLMLLISRTIGKPIFRLRDRILSAAAGTQLKETPDDILLQFTKGSNSPYEQGGIL